MDVSDWLTVIGIVISSVLSLVAIGVGVVVAQRLDRENEKRETAFWEELFSLIQELLRAVLALGRPAPPARPKPAEGSSRGGGAAPSSPAPKPRRPSGGAAAPPAATPTAATSSAPAKPPAPSAAAPSDATTQSRPLTEAEARRIKLDDDAKQRTLEAGQRAYVERLERMEKEKARRKAAAQAQERVIQQEQDYA